MIPEVAVMTTGVFAATLPASGVKTGMGTAGVSFLTGKICAGTAVPPAPRPFTIPIVKSKPLVLGNPCQLNTGL